MNTMARIIDILHRILQNPNKKVKDILSAEDIACVKRVVGDGKTKD